MVDWSLARRIAGLAAGTASAGPLAPELEAAVATAERPLRDYTGLETSGSLPRPEVVARRDWAEINLGTLASLLDPVGERLEARLGGAGPLAGPLRAAAGATLAAEAGLVMGYVSQRVLGQYELSLLQPEAPARLLFVGPNLEAAVRELRAREEGDSEGLGEKLRESFLGWIAIHELVHVLQFSGVGWLRTHLAKLLREYLETVEVRIDRGAAGGLPTIPDPRAIVDGFREGGLAALVQTREQRRLMGRMQATMALIEGYAEHVMDVVGERMLPAYEGLRAGMDARRRRRSAPERVLQRLLGLDLKLAQYELGKRFCDAVAEREDIEALNLVWRAPESLPSLQELDRPERWIERVARPTAGQSEGPASALPA